MRFSLFALLFALCSATASAQQELPDVSGSPSPGSDVVAPGASSVQAPPLSPDFGGFYPSGIRPDWNRPLRYQPFVFSANPSTVNRAGFAPLAFWEGGSLVATGSATSFPGLMGIERGGLMFTQSLGQLTLSLSGEAEKVGYYRGLTTVYSVSGVAMWRFNDALSLTVFGSWQSSNPYISPAMMGYVGSANAGAYLSWDFAEHFGVDAGAQTTMNPYTRRWETRPIVRPYYKLNKDTKFGIDFGGLLYEVVRSHDRGPSNPTIGPPVPMGAPPVRMDRR